jgi:hypothetical protein
MRDNKLEEWLYFLSLSENISEQSWCQQEEEMPSCPGMFQSPGIVIDGLQPEDSNLHRIHWQFKLNTGL